MWSISNSHSLSRLTIGSTSSPLQISSLIPIPIQNLSLLLFKLGNLHFLFLPHKHVGANLIDPERRLYNQQANGSSLHHCNSSHFLPLFTFWTTYLPPMNPMQPPQASDMVPKQTPAANTASTSEISNISGHVPPPSVISHQIPDTSIAPCTSPPSVTLTPEQKAENQKIKDSLWECVMDGPWERVINIYRNYKVIVQTAKISDSKETALHVAISHGKPEVVNKLLKYIDAHVIQVMTDDRKENPLHLAASLGQVDTCKILVEKDMELIGARNNLGETPLFLAAKNGNKRAFYALHPQCPISGLDIRHDLVHCRRNDGNTILHVSILGEYFGNTNFHFFFLHAKPHAVEYPKSPIILK